jgi:F-type H+-transporting ATPase subunit delta
VEEAVALSYAEALLNVAIDAQKVSKIADDFKLVDGSFSAHTEFLTLLTHPKISTTEKKQIIENVFGKAIDGYMKNFLFLLLDKKRFIYLSMIHKAFEKLKNKLEERIIVEVLSPVKLTDSQRQKLTSSLKFFHRKVELVETVDPELLGGIVVKVEDRVWDGSVRRQLSTLEEQLKGAVV